MACALWGASAAQAQPSCSAPDFIDEVINRLAGDKCADAQEPQLQAITKKIDEAKERASDGAEESDAYLKGLHELREVYGDNEGWRAGLVRGISAAVARVRAGKLPRNAFAETRAYTPGIDPEQCTFVVGRRGAEDYGCFVLQQDQQRLPTPVSGGVPMMVHVLPVDEAARAALVLATAHSAINGLKAPDVKAAVERLTKAQRRFDNLRKYGYLQYPWELAVDTALTSSKQFEECQATGTLCTGEAGLDPATVRAIVLHPGVGIAAPGFGDNGKPSLDTAIALSLEVAGAVFYNESFEHYLGFSLGAIVNDGDFRDPRFGAFVHATRWVHLGYLVAFLRDETRYDASLFISMDLGTAFGASFLE
jgi:hypothetical protein